MLNIVCAMEEEAQEIIKHFNLQEKAGYFESEKIRLIITGIGRENVRKVLKKAELEGKLTPNDELLNYGFAGGHLIATGELVAIRCSYQTSPAHNAPWHLLDCPAGYYPSGTVDCFTSDKFVEDCDFLVPCVFDMELNEICKFPNRRIYSLKLISDNLSEAEFDSKIGEYNLDLVMKRIEKILERTE